MRMEAGIQAQIAWALIFSGAEDVLRAQVADYGGLLDQMEAEELAALIEQAQQRLEAMGRGGHRRDAGAGAGLALDGSEAEPVRLYIDRDYTIRLGAPDGVALPLRPLVRALFILFLKHPEGIRLKEREQFEAELGAIYAAIAPDVQAEVRRRRVRRLVDPLDNSFSEKASVLNARLDGLLPPEVADHYKISGANGHPRRIALDPLLVTWM